MKYKIGDKVKLIKGSPLYKSSSSVIATSFVKEDKITYITRIAIGTKHPYNTTGDLGWMNEDDIKPIDEKEKYEIEVEIVDKENLISYLKDHPNKIIVIDSKELWDVIDNES